MGYENFVPGILRLLVALRKKMALQVSLDVKGHLQVIMGYTAETQCPKTEPLSPPSQLQYEQNATQYCCTGRCGCNQRKLKNGA